MIKIIKTIIVSLAIFSVNPAYAISYLDIQKDWAVIHYQLNDKEQLKAFKELIAQAEDQLKQTPDNADLLIWTAIVKSSYADAKQGLEGLKNAKSAKSYLEKSISIDANALNGAAYVMLGTLYDQVPGWPIGFGNKKKAKKFLLKGLEANSMSIDANFFYASHLLAKKDYQQAQIYLEKAKNCPPRSNRPLADKERHKEIDQALLSIQSKLH